MAVVLQQPALELQNLIVEGGEPPFLIFRQQFLRDDKRCDEKTFVGGGFFCGKNNSPEKYTFPDCYKSLSL